MIKWENLRKDPLYIPAIAGRPPPGGSHWPGMDGLVVYDPLGREVKTLVSEKDLPAGKYTAT